MSSKSTKQNDRQSFPVELDEADKRIYRHVRDNGLTMVSPERMFATLLSCHHVVDAGIPGDFVECGVWRGGNAILAADVFRRARASSGTSRHLGDEKKRPERKTWLFDTFSGMSEPTAKDVRFLTGSPASVTYAKKSEAKEHTQRRQDGNTDWCLATLGEVKANFEAARLLDEHVRFVVGDVMETLREVSEKDSRSEEGLPDRISVLRLDTDWYESTKRELEILWPRLQVGGILMIDDYGCWTGSRLAVDEFFAGRRPFFSYLDFDGRLAVKTQ